MNPEVTYLPDRGIISVKALSQYMGLTPSVLIQALTENKIPYIKLSKKHEHWLIRLEDLRWTAKEVKGGEHNGQ